MSDPELPMLVSPDRPPLEGDERFVGVDATVEDFWRFAIPDLRVNNVRGWLAEFLVWRALGVERPRRIEWDAYDVIWEGIRIEVKSSAYLQVWAQKKPSALVFTDLSSHFWPLDAATPAAESSYNADVYVLCVNTAPSHDKYDVLDLAHWHVAVLSRVAVAAIGQKSLSWARVLQASGGEIGWAELPDAVRQAAAENPQGPALP
jgi:hypothetical protein